MSEDLIERLKRPGTWARHADDIIASSATEELIRDNAPFEAAAEIERLQNLTDRLRLEAQIHSGEARTANASLHEAYQAVSGRTGEPGNWNGAEPVKSEIERLRGRLAEAERVIDAVLFAHQDGPGLIDCIDNDGGRYTSQFLLDVIDAAQALKEISR